jgi:hypothetical protein
VQFSNGVLVNTHREFGLGNLMTMAPILDEGVPSFSFRLEGVEQVVLYDITELLGFQREPRNKWMSIEAHWKVFGVLLREKITNKEIVSRTPSSKCFTHGCAKGFWGE